MPVAFVLNLTLGMILAYAAKDRLNAHGAWSSPALQITALFFGVVIFPFAIYCHVVHGSWASLYLVDGANIHVAWRIVFALVQSLGLLIGWVMSVKMLKLLGDRKFLIATCGVGMFGLLLTLVFSERLGKYGNYLDWQGERALPLWQVKLGYVLVLMALAVAAGLIFTAMELHKDGRRVRSLQRLTTSTPSRFISESGEIEES